MVRAAVIIGDVIYVINLSDFSTPTIAASVNATVEDDGNESVFIDDQHVAYLLGGELSSNKLELLDITTLATSSVVGGPLSQSQAMIGHRQMARHGDFLLILRDASASPSANILEIIDVSDPASPSSVQTYDLPSDFATAHPDPSSLKIVGDTLIVLSANSTGTTDSKLGFYDLSALPTITQTSVSVIQSGSGWVTQLLDVVADVAFIWLSDTSSTAYLKAFDISTPSIPSELDSFTLSATNINRFSDVDNGKIYGVTNSTGDVSIHVYDVSDPNDLAEFGSPASPTTNRNIRVMGHDDTLFLITRKNSSSPRNLTLQVWDASTPTALALLGEVLYWATGTNGVLALDTTEVPPEPFVIRRAFLASLTVANDLQEAALLASAEVVSGQGTPVFVDVISEILDAAR